MYFSAHECLRLRTFTRYDSGECERLYSRYSLGAHPASMARLEIEFRVVYIEHMRWYIMLTHQYLRLNASPPQRWTHQSDQY